MRILLSFIFIFGILSFTKGQSPTNQRSLDSHSTLADIKKLPKDTIYEESHGLNESDTLFTLSDSASYYLGVLQLRNTLEEVAADDFNKELFLTGAEAALLRNDFDSIYYEMAPLVTRYMVEVKKKGTVTTKKTSLANSETTNLYKKLHSKSTLADSVSYCMGMYSANRADAARKSFIDFNPYKYMVGLRSVIYNDSINLDNQAGTDLLVRCLRKAKKERSRQELAE